MTKLGRRQRQGSRRRRRNGSSLVELLLALVLFQMAAVAVASLYARAVLDVRRGGAHSAAAIAAQNRLEILPPPTGPLAAPPTPALEYLSARTRQWLSEPPPPPDRVLWRRETTMRIHPLSTLADGRIESREAGASSGSPARAALMAVEVEVYPAAGGPPMATLERIEWIVR